MKSNLIIAFLLLITASTVFGQEIKFTELAYAQRGEFASYVGSDGAIYKIGDRVKIGMPSLNLPLNFP